MKALIKLMCLTGWIWIWATPYSYSEKPPVLEKEKIVSSLEKALSVAPGWEIEIVDEKESPFPGLVRGLAKFRSGKAERAHHIFISTDSRYYLLGNLFETDVDMDETRRKLIRLDGSPSKGKARAPITIVEYSDLQCSACKSAHVAILRDEVLKKYKKEVRFVYKNFPLTRIHKWALQASVACMCAYRQNPKAFWEMQDDIYYEQSSITTDNLRSKMVRSAERLGLDSAQFKECYDQKATMDQVKSDISEGKSLGVRSTPTFVINGRVVAGYPGSPQFKKMIQAFLDESR